MAEERVQRRLAAILAADVVGYSHLMGLDEAGTRARFNAHLNELIAPAFENRQGRIVKTLGDGLLVEFASVVDAVQCAIEIQKGMADRNVGVADDRRIEFRIGVNLGDVLIEGEDIHGDGVNVAARLEGLAKSGEVCISRAARDQIRDKLGYGLEDMGEVAVKNIARPIRVFRVLKDGKVARAPDYSKSIKRRQFWALMSALVLLSFGGMAWWQPWAPDVTPASIARMNFALPDKPSIAVLPFTNLSDDKDQEYFADGITEDIITDISKVSGLFVVSANSSFTYRGKDIEARQIAEDLGVRYLLKGSVRRADDKLRITAQLIDAIKGNHLWTDRYDRKLEDVFAIQSEVTEKVVKAMAVTLKASEHDRLFQKYSTNIDAYDAFLRARRIVVSPSRKSVGEAERLFKRAIELDPGFAGGYAGLAFNYSVKSRLRFGATPKEDARLSLEYAEKAIQVDQNFSWSHIALAGAYLSNGNHDAAVAAVKQAILIQPNGYEENLFMGFYQYFAGHPALAVNHLEIARRISPIDTLRGVAFLANAYFMNGDYAKSEELRLIRIREFRVGNPNSYVWLAATQAQLGKSTEAKATAEKVRQLWPDFRLSQWGLVRAFKSPENRQRLYDAAAKAGLPE